MPGFGFNDYPSLKDHFAAEARVPAPPRRGPLGLPTGWWPSPRTFLRFVLVVIAALIVAGWILTALNS